MLFEATGTEHRILTAYHPQTNGLVERFDQILHRSVIKNYAHHVLTTGAHHVLTTGGHHVLTTGAHHVQTTGGHHVLTTGGHHVQTTGAHHALTTRGHQYRLLGHIICNHRTVVHNVLSIRQLPFLLLLLLTVERQFFQ